LDNVYMLCNNNLRYPIFDEIDLETYGLFKTVPVSGSGTDELLVAGTSTPLEWFNITSNPGGNLSPDLIYSLDFDTQIRGLLNLNFQVSSSSAGNGIPQFFLDIKDTGGATVSTTELVNYNNFMSDVQLYNSPQTKTEKFELLTEWSSGVLPADTYKFFIRYEVQGTSNFSVKLNPDGAVLSYLQVTKVNQGGDGLVMNIANNMPFGTSGIKLIDFITSIQKKYNLVIYPNQTKNREFIVETFNNWYNKGQVRDFNKYINLNEKISAIPANNLAVNELNFGDTLDGDYISQQFSKAENREYGKSYYVDTENFFSQGKFEVKTRFASTPLGYLANTGTSGSASQGVIGFNVIASAVTDISTFAQAQGIITLGTEDLADATATASGPSSSDTAYSPLPAGSYFLKAVNAGDTIVFTFSGGGTNHDYRFVRNRDGVFTDLDFGSTSTATFNYTIDVLDVNAGFCYFSAIVFSGD
jgi:hypothetical protein